MKKTLGTACHGEPVHSMWEVKELDRWIDLYAFRSGAPARDEVAIVFNDITKRKQLEEQLRQNRH